MLYIYYYNLELFIYIIVPVVVNSTSCKHHDLSMCYAEISCNNVTKEVGCEHDVCTCVDIPVTDAPPQSKLDTIFISSTIGEHRIYTIDTHTSTFMNIYMQI